MQITSIGHCLNARGALLVAACALGTIYTVNADDPPGKKPAAAQAAQKLDNGNAGADVKKPHSVDEQVAREKVRQLLEQPAGKIEFLDEPLQNVLTSFRQKFGLPLEMDKKALRDAGIDPTYPITARILFANVGSALRHMLSPYDLTTVWDGESLMVTTIEAASARMELHVYDIADIAPTQRDMEELIGVIVASAPLDDRWMDGDPGSICSYRGMLVVSQVPAVHQYIEKLLPALRSAKPPLAAQNSRAIRLDETNNTIKVRQALDKRLDFAYVETPLTTVAADLRQRLSIEVQIDRKALANGGIGVDTPVTRATEGLTARQGLKLLLGAAGMTFVIDDDVLLITTQEAANLRQVVRVYAVGDLAEEDELGDLKDVITTTIAPSFWPEGTGPIPFAEVTPFRALVFLQTADVHDEIEALLTNMRKVIAARKALPAEPDDIMLEVYKVLSPGPNQKPAPAVELVALIKDQIEPQSWDDAAGKGYIRAVGDNIVIKHTASVHRQVAKLLEKFNAYPSTNIRSAGGDFRGDGRHTTPTTTSGAP